MSQKQQTIDQIVQRALSTIPLTTKSDSSLSLGQLIEHNTLFKRLGDWILRTEGKEFIVDEQNQKVLRFLMLYFNGDPAALKVFPEENYSLNKGILLVGTAGTGKTLIMQVFSEYLRRTSNPLAFRNIGATELLNYHKMNNHINLFTYNVSDSKSFDGKPFHVCMNDIGFNASNQRSFGTDMNVIIDEFLYARYEIWTNKGIRYHLTSNLSAGDFKQQFDGRLVDRMKAFNMIELNGASRR